MRRTLPVALTIALGVAFTGGPADATYRGHNGLLAFLSQRGTSQTGVFTMHSDGSRVRRLTGSAPEAGGVVASPDGRWIAFLSSNTDIWIAHPDGTGLRKVATRYAWSQRPTLAWSPASTRIAYAGGRQPDLWTVDIRTGKRRRLVAGRGIEEDPSWSRSGRIAFVRGDSIFVTDAKGSAPRAVLRGRLPALSPDGRRIVFLGTVTINGDETADQYFVAALDGGDPRPLGKPLGATFPFAAVWSPDGSRVLIGAECDNGDYVAIGLEAIRPDGTAAKVVACDSEPDGQVTWLANATRVAYPADGDIHWHATPGSSSGILFAPHDGLACAVQWLRDGRTLGVGTWRGVFTIHPDGSGRSRVASVLGDCPTWAPDGKRYATDDGADGISIVGVPSQLAWILKHSEHDDPVSWDPAWSPDGSSIAYVEALDEEPVGELSILDLGNVQIRGLEVETSGGITWSPDGRRIAYATSDVCGHRPCTSVFWIDRRTTRVHVLVQNASYAVWSPDARRIAFVRGQGKRAEIWIARADGTHQRRLTHNDVPDVAPDWQPLP